MKRKGVQPSSALPFQGFTWLRRRQSRITTPESMFTGMADLLVSTSVTKGDAGKVDTFLEIKENIV